MERRIARLALYAGVALVALGLIVLYLGYNGTATNALQVKQIPYLVSGGFAGLALIVLGAAGITASVLLMVEAGIRDGLGVLNDSVQEMTEVLSRRAFDPAAATAPLNGTALVTVSRGAASFHRPDCRLVATKTTVRTLPREEAESNGLLACRVCKP